METKRCTYCHKLQRVGNRVCSCCGRPFDRYWSRSGRSRSNSRSLFSLPAASPHRIGHYSGLHPEDQPYQSQWMIMPQRFVQEMQEKKALQEGPKHIVLPSVQNAPVGNRRRSISQAPIHRPFPTRRSRRRLASEHTLRGTQQTQGIVGRDVEGEREQISRPFVREVISLRAETSPISANLTTQGTHSPGTGDRKGRDGVNPSSTLRSVNTPRTSTRRGVDEGIAPSPDRGRTGASPIRPYPPLRSLGPDHAPSPKFAPTRTSPVPTGFSVRTRRWPSRMMSTVVISAGFCVLLAISISVLILLSNHAAPAQAHKGTSHTPTVQTIVPTPSPRLQVPTNQAVVFTAAAPGIASNQKITLKNGGSGQVAWQGNSDQSWLTISPKSGTFADSEDIQITVNRGGMTPGNYTGHITVSQQGQESNPVVLNVKMSVATPSVQLSISTTSLSYSTAQSQSPDSQKITISNIGRQSLPWDATTQNSPSWVTLSLYHGLIPPGVVQSITVSVTSQDLATGTYTELISFIDHANAQVMAQVQVTLTVLTPGNLLITPSNLALTTQQPTQTLSLQNNGGFSLDWTVTPSTKDQGNWLSVTSSSSGTLASGDSVTVRVSADATSLAPGTYQGTLTFSVGGQTQQVTVSFAVTLTPTPTG